MGKYLSWWQKLKIFFGYFPNDWRMIWSTYGNWIKSEQNPITTGHAYYYIEFSETRDAYRLRMDGKDADSHTSLGIARAELSRRNSELLEIRFKDKARIKRLKDGRATEEDE